MSDLNRIVALVMMVTGLGLIGSVGWSVAERHYPELLNKPTNKDNGVLATTTDANSAQVSVYRVDDIVRVHLFGDPIAEAAAEVVVAPETKLNLNLIGVLASDDSRLARVLIRVNANKEKTYSIGQQIDSTDALVHKIESERVILDRNGNFESLAMNRQKALASVPQS